MPVKIIVAWSHAGAKQRSARDGALALQRTLKTRETLFMALSLSVRQTLHGNSSRDFFQTFLVTRAFPAFSTIAHLGTKQGGKPVPVIGRTTESMNARIEKDALAQLREWARPSGAVGRVISRLVWQEIARQQEREKVKHTLASAGLFDVVTR